ncbi:hypothetical protein EBT16_09105 [bacterium]|nr:hypothetical protein [bacterium]
MSAKKNFFVSLLLIAFFVSACAIKRSKPDFKTFEELEQTDTQMEFPITPGGKTTPSETALTKKNGITLVLGGAGIASFATVGLLKRLKTEGVKVDLIVASGWPAMFALAYGSFKSVHDLEWFAMRLQSEDFEKACRIKKGTDLGSLSKLVESFLKKKELQDSQIPIVIVAGNTENEKQGVFDSGDWSTPLLKTLPLPGLYRGFPEQNGSFPGVFDLQSFGVSEARKRGASPIFVVNMYSDYLNFFKDSSQKENPEKPTIRKIFLASLRKNIREEAGQADGVFEVELKGNPLDFSRKRAAFLAGSQKAVQIIRKIWK